MPDICILKYKKYFFFYIILDEKYLIFWLLVGQNQQYKDDTLGSGKIRYDYRIHTLNQ